ncbi:rifin, partial [Plasmodium reichenowi]
MKLHYSKILLFALTLNILAHNKNKIYITTCHTPTTTPRVLSEYDTQSSIYVKDADIKSVMQQFDDRTSQRFEEYEERKKDKCQKHKEVRDKNIKEIIEKDKMDKSLAEKVEKCCLKCGCGLGGVAASVGLFGGLGIYGWKSAALAAAVQKGIRKGIATVLSELDELAKSFNSINIDILGMINAETYRCPQALTTSIYAAKQNACVGDIVNKAPVCTRVGQGGNPFWFNPKVLEATTEGASVAKTTEAAEIVAANATSTQLYSAIGYTVLAILIIVLVMIIIYLVLRYRRKKKMNKKAQYTKLLN